MILILPLGILLLGDDSHPGFLESTEKLLEIGINVFETACSRIHEGIKSNVREGIAH
jgi:hypothetical protein